jgi:hypothetical protein
MITISPKSSIYRYAIIIAIYQKRTGANEKPVMDFKNQNMAWYIIQESLRVMIDKASSLTDQGFYTNPVLPKDVLSIFERIVSGRVDL